MRPSRIAVVLVFLAWHVVAGHRNVETYRSNATLWGHAHAVAPLAIRPMLNAEKAAYER
jgi:hypothetical protein